MEEQKDHSMKKKKWGLGLFLGKNNHNKAICYCISLINIENKDTFMGVFKSFFEMMNGEPSAIITDEQAAIESALRQLKEDGVYNGEHLLDTFHIIRNILKKTGKEELISAFRDAIFAKTHEEFKKCLEIAR